MKKTTRKIAACLVLFLLTLTAGCASEADGQAHPDGTAASVPREAEQPAEPVPEPEELPPDEPLSDPQPVPRPAAPSDPLPGPILPEEGLTADPGKTGHKPGTLTDGSGLTWSANTLIVLLDPSVDKDAAREIAQRHGTEMIYYYTILSGMAVRTERNLSAKELDALSAAFREEAGVTGVNRDAVTELDDPITAPEVMG